MAAPLSGIRIVELAGIGPAPFAGIMLADHGATSSGWSARIGRR
ncbi:MAG TPA: hypothetical protein VF718_03270 [Allosphingosinicella sp.]|jgi:alpha-methylacyl-CoA racemase